jgi:hypothetical protein
MRIWQAGIVTYTSKWERLSAAVDRITQSAGISREQAEADLCRALSDGVIEIRARLKKHASGLQLSRDEVNGSYLHIPSQLKSSDFDWRQSRPTAYWELIGLKRHLDGYWQLEWIEVAQTDVTRNLLSPEASAAQAGPKAPSKEKKKRATPRLDAANQALAELYKDGIPAYEVNDQLVRRVIKHVKEKYKLVVSRETVLRAADRRK